MKLKTKTICGKVAPVIYVSVVYEAEGHAGYRYVSEPCRTLKSALDNVTCVGYSGDGFVLEVDISSSKVALVAATENATIPTRLYIKLTPSDLGAYWDAEVFTQRKLFSKQDKLILVHFPKRLGNDVQILNRKYSDA